MLKVLVPVKRVVDYDAKVRMKSDGTGADIANVKMSMNPFDEIAVEEVVCLKEAGVPKALIDDELWSLIEPLLPARPPRARQYAGRKPTPDRAVLTGIVFVLRTGVPWNMLPQEMGCGSGTACWRRLVAWQQAGVWQRIHETLLAELRRRGQLDLARTIVGSSSVRAVLAGKNRAEPDGPPQAR